MTFTDFDIRTVWSVAWKYQRRNTLICPDVEELVSAGLHGLVVAKHRWDGVRPFGTFAYWWVRKYILNEVRLLRRGGMVGVPPGHRPSRADLLACLRASKVVPESENELGKYLHLISERHRPLFLLRFQEGLTISEICERLQLSSGTVCKRLSTVIRQLKRELSATADPAFELAQIRMSSSCGKYL